MKSFISDPEQVRVTLFQSYVHQRYKILLQFLSTYSSGKFYEAFLDLGVPDRLKREGIKRCIYLVTFMTISFSINEYEIVSSFCYENTLISHFNAYYSSQKLQQVRNTKTKTYKGKVKAN